MKIPKVCNPIVSPLRFLITYLTLFTHNKKSLLKALVLIPNNEYRPIKSQLGNFEITCEHNSTRPHTLEWYIFNYEDQKKSKLPDQYLVSRTEQFTNKKTTRSKIRVEADQLNPDKHSGDYICSVSFTDGDENSENGDIADQITVEGPSSESAKTESNENKNTNNKIASKELIQKIYVYKPLKINAKVEDFIQYGLIEEPGQKIKCEINGAATLADKITINASSTYLRKLEPNRKEFPLKSQDQNQWTYTYTFPQNLRKEDAGKYSCEISYTKSVKDGNGKTKKIQLQSYKRVNFRVLGRPVVTMKPRNLYFINGFHLSEDNPENAFNVSCGGDFEAPYENSKVVQITWAGKNIKDDECFTVTKNATLDPDIRQRTRKISRKEETTCYNDKKEGSDWKSRQGNYTCVVSNGDQNKLDKTVYREATAEASIFVFDQPVAKLQIFNDGNVDSSLSQNYTEGDVLVAECSSQNDKISPKPVFVVVLSNGDSTNNTGSTKIEFTVGAEHAGNITCVGTSDYSLVSDGNLDDVLTSVSEEVQLNVMFKPKFGEKDTVYVPSKMLADQEFESEICGYQSNPPGNLKVSFKNQDSDQWTDLNVTERDTYSHSFQNGTSETMQFKCVATNDIGDTELIVSVKKAKLPESPVALKSSCDPQTNSPIAEPGTENQKPLKCTKTFLLKWETPENTYLKVDKYIVCVEKSSQTIGDAGTMAGCNGETVKANGDANELMLTGLSHNTEYKIRVSTKTVEGDSEWARTEFQTAEIMKPTLELSDEAEDVSGKIRRGVRIRASFDPMGGSVKKVRVTYTETRPKQAGKTINQTFTAPPPEDEPWKVTTKAEVQFDPKNIKTRNTFDINIESVKELTTYTFCVMIENEAGETKKCVDRTTAAIRSEPKYGSSSFSTPQILVITSLILLIMLVVIDLSCHYMNECGIFSAIIKSRQAPSSTYNEKGTIQAGDGPGSSRHEESKPLFPGS